MNHSENRIFEVVIENHKSQSFYKNLDGFKLLLTSYGYVWLFYLLFFMAIGFLTNYFPEIDTDRYKQTTLVEMLKNEPLKLLVSAVILAPIVEELMFRSIIKTDHWQLLLFISSWLAFFFRMIPLEIGFWPIRILLVAAVIIASFYILQEIIPKHRTDKIVRFLNKYPITITIITSILFGFAHVYNYVDSFFINSALIILVFPRIILGGIAGWLKIKTGVLLWPILLHFLNNAVAVGIMLLSYHYFKH